MSQLSCVFLVILAGASVAGAQPAIEISKSAPSPDPTVALTFSPLHLFVPMAEMTAEVRIAPKFGVAAIGGIGMIRSETTNDRISLFEAGVSARYYLTGSFRSGLQIGGEALYVHASTTNDPSIDVKARGLGLSPFLGYKWTHASGLTLEGQLGVSYLVARGQSDTAMAATSAIGPMLNLNAGWSF